jgi:sarcosine oxidase subunit delta
VSFLIPCPTCGPRDVAEFACTGEVLSRPKERPSFEELTSYLYLRQNVAGVQEEWWFHRFGCEAWFRARRDTRTNEILSVL